MLNLFSKFRCSDNNRKKCTVSVKEKERKWRKINIITQMNTKVQFANAASIVVYLFFLVGLMIIMFGNVIILLFLYYL